jgi:hypothetical protein
MMTRERGRRAGNVGPVVATASSMGVGSNHSPRVAIGAVVVMKRAPAEADALCSGCIS